MNAEEPNNQLTEQQWSIVELRHELSQLKREKLHLEAKQLERPLTEWETQRLELIPTELTAILKEYQKYSSFETHYDHVVPWFVEIEGPSQ